MAGESETQESRMDSPPSSSLIADAGAGNKITSFSYFKKTICLYDWWLINAGKDATEKKIGVSGFTSPESGYVKHTAEEMGLEDSCRPSFNRSGYKKLTAEERGLERQPVRRRFSSAPILKVYDLFTLETTDGICVILNGFINKAHTQRNGFEPEVLNHFLIGFPPEWEKFAESCLGEALSRANEDDIGEVDFENVAAPAQKSGQQAAGSVPCVAATRNHLKVAMEMQESVSAEVSISEKPVSRGDEGQRDYEKGVPAQKDVENAAQCTSGPGASPTGSHSKPVVEKQETAAEEAWTSGCTFKRKLTHESPVTKNIKKKANILSPESLNCKRSRSGRCLLPRLKFWCNQTVIYDSDRQVTGIKVGPYAAETCNDDICEEDFEKVAAPAQKSGQQAAGSVTCVAATRKCLKVAVEMQESVSAEVSISEKPVSRGHEGQRDFEEGVPAQKDVENAAQCTSGPGQVLHPQEAIQNLSLKYKKPLLKKHGCPGAHLKRN